MHLYTTYREVHAHNNKSLKALNKPILLIEALHVGNASKLSDDRFHNLPSMLHLCVGAKVMMTSNVCQPVGLCNGALGKVIDFIFHSTSAPPPSLPNFIWVDFCKGYTGPSYFPNHPARKGWVPLHSMRVEAYTLDAERGDWITRSRTMFPLRLSYATTIWKAQGQTIRGKFVVDLSAYEKDHGLTYTAFSRATSLTNIGIIGGLPCDRLCTKVLQHKKMAPRKKEDERLHLLGEDTSTRFSEGFAPGEDPPPDEATPQPAPILTKLKPSRRLDDKRHARNYSEAHSTSSSPKTKRAKRIVPQTSNPDTLNSRFDDQFQFKEIMRIGQIEDVSPDGNCGFYAVLLGLPNIGKIEHGSLTVTAFREQLWKYAGENEMIIRATAIPSVQNNANGVGKCFSWYTLVLDPLFGEKACYEGGCGTDSWMSAEWHFPLIAYKYNCTIVLYGSDAVSVAGQVRKSTQVFLSNSNKQEYHGGVIVHPRTLKVDMPSTIFLVHQNMNHFLHLSVPMDIQKPPDGDD